MKDWNEVKENAQKKATYVASTTRICPLLSNTETPAECVTQSCAWWDGKYGRCAVLSQACKK